MIIVIAVCVWLFAAGFALGYWVTGALCRR